MTWQISFTPEAEKELARLGAPVSKKIIEYLKERVGPNPKALGGQLKGNLREFWRWRIGEYRVLARIEDEKMLVIVVKVGHRRKIYGGH